MTVLNDANEWLSCLRGEEAGLVAQPWVTSGQALVHRFVVGELLLCGLSAPNLQTVARRHSKGVLG